MPNKDPSTFSIITYMWVFLLAMAGGLVAFIRKLNESKEKHPLTWLFIKLASELIISGFAGVITFYLCEYWQFDRLLTAVLVAISGHLGGNAIDKFTKMWEVITKQPPLKK